MENAQEKPQKDRRHPLKITVLKTTSSEEIFPVLPEGCIATFEPRCPRFKENEVFYVDRDGNCPGGFPCDWAWSDNFAVMTAMRNGAQFRQKRPGIQYTCCSDGLRPVIFKIEWCDDDEFTEKRASHG